MVSGINSGFQQPPASKAFEPNQAPNNPANAQKVAQGPQPGKAQETFVSPNQAEEINSKAALSRDVARPNPSQISSNTQSRGSVLDIVI